MNKEKLQRSLNAEQKHLMKNMLDAVESDKITAVSLEFNDMLVLRPFFDSHDIAFLMEDEFSGLYVGKSSFYELRCRAEQEAAEKKKDIPLKIEDIYKRLMKISKISSSSRDKLIKRERELEEYFCFPRSCGAELYNAAKTAGKKIIVTADTFLPRESVEEILRRCGYGDYDFLCITSECGLRKDGDGGFYRKISEDMGIEADKILHFGCSFEADAEAPVKQGMKSMFVTSCRDRLIKSGRLCGYIQKQLFYDFCTAKYLALRCCIALYAAYSFDYPHAKTPHSDFCGDEYMIGFLILGAMGLYKDFAVESELSARILGAMSENENMVRGSEDFNVLYEKIFGESLEKYGFDSCSLPFEFYVNHGAVGDRMLIQKLISSEFTEKWANDVTEPEIAPVTTRALKKNALSRLADMLFPQGTQIRTIIDKILSKIH